MDLGALEEEVRRFAREREWDQFHSVRNLLLALVGEVGELSELLQWFGCHAAVQAASGSGGG